MVFDGLAQYHAHTDGYVLYGSGVSTRQEEEKLCNRVTYVLVKKAMKPFTCDSSIGVYEAMVYLIENLLASGVLS